MVTILILNIVAFLFMMGINLSSGIFAAYLKSFGATGFIISIAATALYLTRGTTSALIDDFSKRMSFKILFLIACLGSAVSTLLFLIPTNPTIIASLRVVQGIFSGLYWVLINIYASSLGSSSLERFKNLSIVSIFVNVGGFFGSLLGGKIAKLYSAPLSFYMGTVVLLLSAVFCLFLKDVKRPDEAHHKHNSRKKLNIREKHIFFFGILSSIINAYISIGMPLYILHLGGGYDELGTVTALGIGASAITMGFAPALKRRFAYSTIMRTDYALIILSLAAVFYFKNMALIYFVQSLLLGISALERNMWYSILQDHSKNYNRTIGLFRGYIDYFGAVLFLIFGYAIDQLGHTAVAVFMGTLTLGFLLNQTYLRHLKFLKKKRAVHVSGLSHYNHILHRIGV